MSGLVLACFLAITLVGAATASAAQDEVVHDSFQECLDARPMDVDPMSWSCFGGPGGWTSSQAGSSADGGTGGLGALLVVGLLWAGIPLVIAASMASSRGESVGVAIALTLFLGWIGLAIVYFGQHRSRSAVEGLAAAAGTSGAVPAGTADPVSHTRVDAARENRLRELERLRDDGVISGAEYTEQRRRVLDEI